MREVMPWLSLAGIALSGFGVLGLGLAWIFLGQKWAKIDLERSRIVKEKPPAPVNGEMILGSVLILGGLGIIGTCVWFTISIVMRF